MAVLRQDERLDKLVLQSNNELADNYTCPGEPVHEEGKARYHNIQGS